MGSGAATNDPAVSPGIPVPDPHGCDREPIHKLGQVQRWGFLLAAGADEIVCHVSANAADHFGIPALALIGRPLVSLLQRNALHAIRGTLQASQRVPGQVSRLFAMKLLDAEQPYDLAVHYALGDFIVLEAEPSRAEPGFDAIGAVKGMVGRLLRTADIPDLHDIAARQVLRLLEYDRVMIYRFDADSSGAVVGEAIAGAHVPSFRGLHYPASDIPAQARALYRQNLLRLIADVDAPAHPILPKPDRLEAALDLSGATLRSVSPVHLQYMRNMGVTASLSISIMRGEHLWGLIACHHFRPRLPSAPRRMAAELFCQIYGLQLESRERAEAARHDAAARALTDRLLDPFGDETGAGVCLRDVVEQVRPLVPFDGAAIHHDGTTDLLGATPGAAQVADLIEALNRIASAPIIATARISKLHAPAAAYADAAAGMLAIPISHIPRDYLILFRGEQIHTVTWAGDPAKPAEPESDRLSPRRSFAAWQETVRGTSAPWLDAETRFAESLRIVVLELTVRRMATGAATLATAANKQKDVLVGELNHRVRNILAMVRALVSRSMQAARSLEDFVESLDSRIQLLARSHNQLTDQRWGAVALRSVLQSDLDAYLGPGEQNRARLTGPPVLIEPVAVTALALVFHELATNAVKYGALADPAGRVAVSWRLAADGVLSIAWQESGGPPVAPPGRRGFGSTVIERTIPFELGGTASVRYAAPGLKADFALPARFVRSGEAAEPPQAAAIPPTAFTRTNGGAIVVEDNMLLAMDAEDILLELGFKPVEVAGSAAAALQAVDRMGDALTFALLDVNLGDHDSRPVAEDLTRRGIAYAFATGDAARPELKAALDDAAFVIQKPYRRDDIARLFRSAADGD